MILSVPSKTFFLGEYVALERGPSILVATDPRFQLHVTTGMPNPSASPFHSESPAGRFFEKHQNDFAHTGFEFRDPHGGRGGLGASSAEFALLWSYRQAHSGARSGAHPAGRDWTALLNDYHACSWKGKGVPPSGADVVAQINGGITSFDGESKTSQSLSWPFPELGFSLIRTGQKLATHEHLTNTKAEIKIPATLRQTVIGAQNAFQMADERELIVAVQSAAEALLLSGLTAPRTTAILTQMRAQPDLFLAVKGCGAMGADVILALHARRRLNAVGDWAKALGLAICGSLATLSNGIESV